jgi:hypothetical protein
MAGEKSVAGQSQLYSEQDESNERAMPFLMRLLSPEVDSMTEAFQKEPGRFEEAEIIDLPGDPFSLASQTYPGTIGADPNNFLWNFADCDLNELRSSSAESDVRINDRGLNWLDICTANLTNHLLNLHTSLNEEDVTYTDEFSPMIATMIFSPESVKALIGAYFRHTNLDFPVIHRPSFGNNSTAPALLLSVCLCGSMYAAPRDGTLAARRILHLGEEYAFCQLSEQMSRDPSNIELTRELLQSLQAALLIHGLQYTMVTSKARRRNISKRLPALVSAIRHYGLTNYKHRKDGSGTDWKEFIHVESCLR